MIKLFKASSDLEFEVRIEVKDENIKATCEYILEEAIEEGEDEIYNISSGEDICSVNDLKEALKKNDMDILYEVWDGANSDRAQFLYGTAKFYDVDESVQKKYNIQPTDKPTTKPNILIKSGKMYIVEDQSNGGNYQVPGKFFINNFYYIIRGF